LRSSILRGWKAQAFITFTMADADEDVSHMSVQEGMEHDPTEETQDFRFLDKLMCDSYHIVHSVTANQSAIEEATM
jgi:hypothetical protein